MTTLDNRISDPGDFLRGMRDCQKGHKHKSGQSKDYDRGYNTQYAHEQNMTALSVGGGK